MAMCRLLLALNSLFLLAFMLGGGPTMMVQAQRNMSSTGAPNATTAGPRRPIYCWDSTGCAGVIIPNHQDLGKLSCAKNVSCAGYCGYQLIRNKVGSHETQVHIATCLLPNATSDCPTIVPDKLTGVLAGCQLGEICTRCCKTDNCNVAAASLPGMPSFVSVLLLVVTAHWYTTAL